MIDFVSYLPAKKKTNSSGWTTFNAPCCVHNGESADKRSRGGFIVRDDGWSYHCFNCGYTASFTWGRNLSFKARRLLTWIGVDETELGRINLESMRQRSLEDIVNSRSVKKEQLPEFKPVSLPEGLTPLTDADEPAQAYAKKRCLPRDYPLMQHVTETGRTGLLVPFTHNHEIVGYTTRFLDDRTPKYVQNIQTGYVFGIDLQKPDWEYVFVVEGVLDALCIDAVAVLHNDINTAQSAVIKSLNTAPIVVPDQDKSGVKLIDRAIELGWGVSIPDWGDDIKDVNDAVAKYGKLSTAVSIINNSVHSKIKIELAKKALIRKIS